MPVWLRKERVLEIHAEQLERHGGLDGFLDGGEGRLEAALARPKLTVDYLPETDIAELAASFAVAIVKGHPFIDGNKRTACVASLLFLRFNGVEISASDDDLAQVFEHLAEGTVTQSELADWFLENSVPDE